MTSWNPIRRSPLKKRPRAHKESMPWRRPKVRLNGKEMAELRQAVFARSEGSCENSVTSKGERCPARIYWGSFHLAHIVSRGRGGNDSLKTRATGQSLYRIGNGVNHEARHTFLGH